MKYAQLWFVLFFTNIIFWLSNYAFVKLKSEISFKGNCKLANVPSGIANDRSTGLRTLRRTGSKTKNRISIVRNVNCRNKL